MVLTNAHAHRQLVDIALLISYGKLYLMPPMTARMMQETLHRIYHGHKETGIMSVAKDVVAENPICKYLTNLTKVVGTNGISDGGERALVSELCGRTVIVMKNFEGKQLHYASIKFSQKDLPLASKSLLRRAKQILCEVKKYYAMWRNCLNTDGSFRSGTNEHDVREEVRSLLYRQSGSVLSHEVVDAAASEEVANVDSEDSEDETSEYVVTWASTSPTGSVVPDDWNPPHWWAFLLLGPYAAVHWGNIDVHHLLAVDGDIACVTKSDGRAAGKKRSAVENEIEREYGPGRGISGVQQKNFAIRQHEIQQQNNESNMLALKFQMDSNNTSYMQAKEMNEMEDARECYHEAKRLRAEIETIRKLMNEKQEEFNACLQSATMGYLNSLSTPSPSPRAHV